MHVHDIKVEEPVFVVIEDFRPHGAPRCIGENLLYFGLGTTATTADVTVTWPDGAVLRQRGVAAYQHLVLRRR